MVNEDRASFVQRIKRAAVGVVRKYFSVTGYEVFSSSVAAAFPAVSLPDGFELIVVRGLNPPSSLPELSLPATMGDLKAGLKCGAQLFCVMYGSKLAHASWVADTAKMALFDSVFRNVNVGKGGVIGPCFTDGNYRGKGLYPFALVKAREHLHREGVSEIFINTKPTNLSSKKGIAKAGFVHDSYVYRIKIGSCSKYLRVKR